MDFSSHDRNRSHHHHHRKPLFTYDKAGVKRYKEWLADGRNQDKNKGHNIIISVEESGNESSESVVEKQSFNSKVECRKSSHDMHGGKIDNSFVTGNNFDENDDVRPTLSSSTNIGTGLDVFCWDSGKNNSSIENKDMIFNKSPIVCQRKHNEYIIESTTPEPVEPSSEIVKRNLLGNGCFSESFSENKHLSVTNIVNEPDCEKVIEYEHAKGIKTKLKKEDKSTMENDESSCIEFFAPINQKKDLSSDGSSLKSTKHACIGSRNSSDHQVQIIDLTNETNYSSSLSNNPKKCSNSEDATMISSNQKGVYRKLNFSGPILTKNCNQIAEQIDSIDKIDTQKITQAVVSEKNTNEIEKCSLVSHTCQYSNNTSTKWDHLWKYDGIVSHCSAVNVNMAEAPVPCKVIEIKEEKEIFNQNDSMFTHQEKNENHPSQEIESDQQIVKDDNCQSEINFSPRYDKENNHGVLIKSETDANREMESESHYECQNESDFEEEEDEETLSMKVESKK
ncbi:uncharacterized protein [Clytia hemisphaerica]|uniref:uncharacterized protein n=1 Tax=Clytia hemisphaerica TaxID=252671 RepID=UPI0034D3C91E